MTSNAQTYEYTSQYSLGGRSYGGVNVRGQPLITVNGPTTTTTTYTGPETRTTRVSYPTETSMGYAGSTIAAAPAASGTYVSATRGLTTQAISGTQMGRTSYVQPGATVTNTETTYTYGTPVYTTSPEVATTTSYNVPVTATTTYAVPPAAARAYGSSTGLAPQYTQHRAVQCAGYPMYSTTTTATPVVSQVVTQARHGGHHHYNESHHHGHQRSASGTNVIGDFNGPAQYPAKQRKYIIKHQKAGCCGCCNTKGMCDKPGGKCGCFNCGGCCNREKLTYKRLEDPDTAIEEQPKKAPKKKGC